MSNKTQNINFGGNQNNVQFGEGDNHMQVSQSSGGELTAEQFFAAIEAETKQLPEVDRVAIQSGAVEPLKELAMAGEATETISKSVQTSTFSKYLEILRPHAALIMRCTAAFGEAALAALVSKNPIVAGVVAIASEVRKGV